MNWHLNRLVLNSVCLRVGSFRSASSVPSWQKTCRRARGIVHDLALIAERGVDVFGDEAGRIRDSRHAAIAVVACLIDVRRAGDGEPGQDGPAAAVVIVAADIAGTGGGRVELADAVGCLVIDPGRGVGPLDAARHAAKRIVSQRRRQLRAI